MQIAVLEEIFDRKKLSILKFLLQNPERNFYLQEITEQANVPVATTFRILQRLIKAGVVEEVRVSRLKLYKIGQNEKVDFLEKIFREDKQALEEFVEKMSKLKDIEQIILHGKKTTSRANILIISNTADPEKIKRVVGEIKDKYKFTISHLTLNQEQYKQMSQMGLYSGEKKVLFES